MALQEIVRAENFTLPVGFWCKRIMLSLIGIEDKQPSSLSRLGFAASQRFTGSSPGRELRQPEFLPLFRNPHFFDDFGGREGIRTPNLLIANEESLKLRRVATIS